MLVVEGARPLSGSVNLSGGKNASLQLIASSLLSPKNFRIKNLPNVSDVEAIFRIFSDLGAQLERNPEDKSVKICTNSVHSQKLSPLSESIRGSILLVGPLLARFGKVTFPLPGGCELGPRPINYHLDGLGKMGVTWKESDNYIIGEAPLPLKGIEFDFPKPSLTGTANLVMAACLAKGTSRLTNVAMDPEINELLESLILRGAKIKGKGTRILEIDGDGELLSGEHIVLADRIEGGTFIIGTAATKGKILLRNFDLQRLQDEELVLKDMGINFTNLGENLEVDASGVNLNPFSIKSSPFPGICTDMQPQFCALAACIEGTSTIEEGIFQNRMNFIPELEKFGVSVEWLNAQKIKISGSNRLKGAKVNGQDLRGFASLLIAGLAAEGSTRIQGFNFYQRGYESPIGKFRDLGAKINLLST